MYIIIAGGGVIGSHIASLLAEEGHEVVVLEQSREALENIRRQLDVKTIQGNSATPTILKQAEAERADLVLAVTNNDETNMVTCFMAKELGAGTTAARIRNPDYSGYFVAQTKSPTATRKIVRPKKLGIDVFINPEAEAAREIMGILSSFYSTPVENFADGTVQIREFRVEDEALVDKPLSQIEFLKPCVVAAIVREGEVITPGDDDVIVLGDSVHLVSAREFMDELGGMFSAPKRPARKVVIVGGGQIAFLTAEGLQRQGVMVKVIDSDADRCRDIAAKLEKVVVLQGDGTDRSFLIEQGVPSADAFIATTDSDELNILCGLLAKNLGVPRSLVAINRPGYIPLAEAIGVDIAALPTLLTADKITRFVLHGGVISTALLEGQQLEAIEFVTSPTSNIADKKISEAGLPKEAVVGAIVRNNTVIIPPRDEVVQPGDHVIVVSPLPAVHSVEKLFQ
ncbi:MAG TPA: Trk system potassium transporter TrkA [Dehalococcoidia bacterium]|nr:Trk system potassium transporter TrkA [Dehalococcoidia bacterium]